MDIDPHVTYDVTIDLDNDDEVQPVCCDEDYSDDDFEEYGVYIDEPISSEMLKIRVSRDIRVRQLPSELRELMIVNLDFPALCSVSSWVEVAEPFNIPPTDYAKIENSQNPSEKFIDYLADHSAQKLFEAFEKTNRIDVLYLIKKFIQKNGILVHKELPRQFPQLHFSTETDFTNTYSTIETHAGVNLKNVCLVTHFETTDIERKHFKWFMKNLRKNLENVGINKIVPLDVADLERSDSGNILDEIHNIFVQVPHVIVCYNTSYIEALASKEASPLFKFRKYIHQQTISEFFTNGMKNRRFRCVLMPGMKTAETTGWAPVSIQYAFPEGLEILLNRLIKLDNSNLNTL